MALEMFSNFIYSYDVICIALEMYCVYYQDLNTLMIILSVIRGLEWRIDRHLFDLIFFSLKTPCI